MEFCWKDTVSDLGMNAAEAIVGPFVMTIYLEAGKAWWVSTSPLVLCEALGDPRVMCREYAKKMALRRLREALQGVIDEITEEQKI